MTRILQPELLDTLPAENPEATHSRADLRRVNWWMGHRRILLRALKTAPLTKVIPPFSARELSQLAAPPPATAVGSVPKASSRNSSLRITELGAGDGTLALSLATQLHTAWPKVELTFVDQQRLVAPGTMEKFERLGWHPRIVQTDVFKWLAAGSEPADIIFANLFLHHFDDAGLQHLLREATARCSCFIALEPDRHWTARLGCELLWLIGCNRVTRHDARLSVRAGFRGQELSQLWPSTGNWVLHEQSAGLFSHLFVATRASA